MNRNPDQRLCNYKFLSPEAEAKLVMLFPWLSIWNIYIYIKKEVFIEPPSTVCELFSILSAAPSTFSLIYLLFTNLLLVSVLNNVCAQTPVTSAQRWFDSSSCTWTLAHTNVFTLTCTTESNGLCSTSYCVLRNTPFTGCSLSVCVCVCLLCRDRGQLVRWSWIWREADKGKKKIQATFPCVSCHKASWDWIWPLAWEAMHVCGGHIYGPHTNAS